MTFAAMIAGLGEGSLLVLLGLLPISKAAIEICVPLMVLSWGVLQWRERGRQSVWRTPAGRICLIALLGYLEICALSVLTSTYPELSARGLTRKTLEYALAFLAAADVVVRPGVAPRCVRVLLVSACVVGVDAIAQEVLGKDLLRGHALASYGRMTGPYENPIDLGTYLAVIIPVLIACLWRVRVRDRWWLSGLLVMLVGCLIRTASQGAWLSLGVALGLMGLGIRRVRRFLLVGGGGALAVIGGYLLTHRHLLQTVQVIGLGVQDRWVMWQAAWRMMQDRPWLGVGLNTFMANYLSYWVGGERQPRYAHNCFLQIGAEIGLVGLVGFVVFLGVMLWIWWRAARWLADAQPTRMWLIGLGTGLMGFLAQSAFDTNLYALRQAVLFWTLAGMATGFALHHTRDRYPLRTGMAS